MSETGEGADRWRRSGSVVGECGSRRRRRGDRRVKEGNRRG